MRPDTLHYATSSTAKQPRALGRSARTSPGGGAHFGRRTGNHTHQQWPTLPQMAQTPPTGSPATITQVVPHQTHKIRLAGGVGRGATSNTTAQRRMTHETTGRHGETLRWRCKEQYHRPRLLVKIEGRSGRRRVYSPAHPARHTRGRGRYSFPQPCRWSQSLGTRLRCWGRARSTLKSETRPSHFCPG